MSCKLFCALLAGASFTLAAASAHAAPPIAYSLPNHSKGVDLFLVNPNGTGKTLLYSTPPGTNFTMLDINPVANQLAIVPSTGGIRIINYSSAGVLQSVVPVNDGCQIAGIDFHPTDGSLLVSEYCYSRDMLQVRRWTSAGFDTDPLVTFGSGQSQAIGRIRWLGDGSGFLLAYSQGGTSGIERHKLESPGSPVTLVSFPTARMPPEFDTARCGNGSTGACWAMMYDDGAGRIHKVHFDDLSTTEDWVLAGSTPHFSPTNSQTLYRLQTHTDFLLKIDNFALVSKGSVQQGIDWRSQ